MAGESSYPPCQGVLLSTATATQCNAGVIGAASAGVPYDTILYGVYIQLNATAASCTIAGLKNAAGAAANMLVSGSTTVDYFWMPPSPILNAFAAFVFTASAANLVWVFTRAYNGPEKPEFRVNT